MIKYLICLSILLFSEVVASQVTEEMMLLEGEKQQKDLPSIFQVFQKAKAWNVSASAEGLLSDVANIDILDIGGRVRSVLIDSANDIFLAAPSGGGIWKFKIDGSSFTPVDDFGSFLAATYITQNPFDKKQILISTGDEFHGADGSGLFLSNDRGNSFRAIEGTNKPEFRYIKEVKYSPEQEGAFYFIANWRRLYRTLDHGKTFELVFESNRTISSFDFGAGSSVVCSVANIGCYKSENGDAGTFELITNGLPNDSEITGAVDNSVFASFHNNRNVQYCFFAVSDDTSSSGYRGDLYKSIDNGSSWNLIGPIDIFVSAPWFTLMLGVHPTNSDILVAGSVGEGSSIDGGQSWIVARQFEVDFHDINFDLSNPDVAAVGYDQGIGVYDFSRPTVHRVWSNGEVVDVDGFYQKQIGKERGFNTSQIYYGDYYPADYGDAIVFGQQDGGSFAKVGEISNRVLVGDGGSIWVNRQDPNKIIGCTQRGRLFKTVSGLDPLARGYNPITNYENNYPNFITQFACNEADSDQIYITSNTSLDRSLDFGDSFEPILNIELLNTRVVVSNELLPTIYMSGYSRVDNQLLNTIVKVDNATDANPTISQYPGLLTNEILNEISVNPFVENSLYATTRNGDALRIDGLGGSEVSISNISGDAIDVPFNVIFPVIGEQEFLLGGTDIGLFYSDNGGQNWVLVDDIPYSQVRDIKLRPEDNRLFIFTHGRGAWAATLSIDDMNTSTTEALINIFKVYPNPSSGEFNIEISESHKAVIFDVNGKQVLSTSDQKNLLNLESGVYIIHIYQKSVLAGIQKIIID